VYWRSSITGFNRLTCSINRLCIKIVTGSGQGVKLVVLWPHVGVDQVSGNHHCNSAPVTRSLYVVEVSFRDFILSGTYDRRTAQPGGSTDGFLAHVDPLRLPNC